MEGDPFHSSGFITAFSQLNIQQQGAFTLTARTFAGDLAELERILAELEIDAPHVAASIPPSSCSFQSPIDLTMRCM